MSVRRAVVCAPMMPEFDRESGSRRLFDLIGLLQEEGWQVSFACRQTQPDCRYVEVLQQRGIPTYTGLTGADAEFVFATCRFQLAICAFWYLAEELLPILRSVSPETRVIVDSVDLHFVRHAREAFCADTESASTQRRLNGRFGDETTRELNAYAAADAVLTVSQKEAALINDLTGSNDRARCVPDFDDFPISDVPRAKRRGILFLGNFRHPPNVSAAFHLCHEILPHVDSELLKAHPVSMVGNGLNDRILSLRADQPDLKLVGWVPSVLPYLSQARISVVPLLYGAGTKRKLLQALMTGTPTVSTRVGVEGIDLRNDSEVLIADDPRAFAESIERLLSDDPLWERLSSAGRSRISRSHSREAARNCLRTVIDEVFARPARRMSSPASEGKIPYQQLIARIRTTLLSAVPTGAIVAVVSKGDSQLLETGAQVAVHFPQGPGGEYAGHHPADGSDAIRHLDVALQRGAEYLLFPSTSFWWLEHYSEFREHLEQRGQVAWQDDDCLIYRFLSPNRRDAAQSRKRRSLSSSHACRKAPR